MKVEISMAANWAFRNEEFTTGDIRLAIKDGLPKPMRDELDDHPEDYRSLTYEDWCDLLYNIKVKDERKRASGNIKKIAAARVASLSESNKPVRIPRRKKAKTGVSNPHKTPRRAHDRHHVTQRYYILCKKAGMTERRYMSHSIKDCTGMRTKRNIKDRMGGPSGSRNHAVQQHKKTKKKWKKELKALKKQNKMLYRIAKKSGSRCELHKTRRPGNRLRRIHILPVSIGVPIPC